MNRIEINKRKAVSMLQAKVVLWTTIYFIAWAWISRLIIFMLNNPYPDYGGGNKNILIFSGYISIIILQMINYLYEKRKISTLEQEYDNDELITRYEVIVKHKDSARLQVVNNVNTTQGIWDKIFGFFNIEVDYGFGDDGYTHRFNYLSEQQAEEISHSIKPHSKLGVFVEKKNE